MDSIQTMKQLSKSFVYENIATVIEGDPSWLSSDMGEAPCLFLCITHCINSVNAQYSWDNCQVASMEEILEYIKGSPFIVMV